MGLWLRKNGNLEIDGYDGHKQTEGSCSRERWWWISVEGPTQIDESALGID